MHCWRLRLCTSLGCGYILLVAVQGLTALHYAIHERNRTTVDFLLGVGASVDAQDHMVCLSFRTAA